MAKPKAAAPAAPKLSRLERLKAELEKEQAKAEAAAAAKAERLAKRNANKESKVRDSYESALKSLDVAERLLEEATAKYDKAQARMDLVHAEASELGIDLDLTAAIEETIDEV